MSGLMVRLRDAAKVHEVGKCEFTNHREAALGVLNSNIPLSRRAGQFLGQLVADTSPLSDAQAKWLCKLLSRAGLPTLSRAIAP